MIINKKFKTALIYFNQLNKVLFFSIIFLPIVPLIKFKNIRIGLLKSSRIGHFTLDFETYLAEKKLLKKKTSDYVFLEKEISNTYILNEYNKKYKLYRYNFVFYQIYRCFKNSFFLRKHIIDFSQSPKYFDLINKNKIIINDENLIKKNTILDQLNIPSDSKWVCIHNRDSQYLENFSKKFNYHSFRNFSINDFLPSAKLLNLNNFYVIRMGNSTKSKLDNNKHIIDYANSPFQNDFNDFYLLKNSSFFIGGDSGPWAMSFFLKKKLSIINYSMLGYLNKFYYWNTFPMLFKLIKEKNNDHYLTFKEIKKNNFHKITDSSILEKEGLELVNNSREDIYDLTEELLKLYLFKEKNNYINNSKEFEFLKKFNEFFPNESGKISSITFPKKFINKNYFLLN